MTLIEGLFLIALAGVVGGFMQRRNPAGRGIMIASLVMLNGLLAMFGSEFLSDLF